MFSGSAFTQRSRLLDARLTQTEGALIVLFIAIASQIVRHFIGSIDTRTHSRVDVNALVI